MPTPLENLYDALIYVFTQGLTYTDGEMAKAFVATEISEAIDEFVTDSVTATSLITTTEPPSPEEGAVYFGDGILKIWNGFFWQGAPVTYEPFIHPTGDTITFLASVANGGSGAAVTAVVNTETADINSATLQARQGVFQISINTNASAFAAFTNTSATNTQRAQLSLKGGFFLSYTWQLLAPATVINFGNDPVLACAGLVTFITTTVVNPLTGIYLRLPRSGETQFVKYVVREGGVENPFNTSIAVNTNVSGYVKTALLWDGLNDTMYFIAGANGVYDIKYITSFSTTYPAAFAALYHTGVYLGRNGAGLVPATTTIRIDEYERYILPNYPRFI